ncbi:MAG TPA: TetR/AcrR family transcriptional regulator [Thermomicrobiales bacterium]|nr:TetR/AcrR family transcriptional regulator [Thermomicrobiales bacterium]
MTRVTPEHTDARLREIERAAFTVFARLGSEKATMAEIAREAGLSAGALYLYYPSKADLLRAVCVDKSTDVQAVFETAAAAGGTPLETLERIAELFAEMFDSEGYEDQVIVGFEAAIAAARDPEQFGDVLCDNADALAGALRELVVAAQRAGEIDAGIDAERLATVLHAVGLGLRELRLIRRGAVDARGAFGVVLEMLRRMAPGAAQPDRPGE